ncbi:hypothetical protein ACU61A_12555 [Pseudonocardia sichuanensis]
MTPNQGASKQPDEARLRRAVAFAAVTDQHVTDVLANWYLFLWQALGDAIAEVSGLPGSPSAQWRHDQRDAANGGPVPIADYPERSAVQAAQAVRQHVRLLSRAYWPNPHNPRAEDPDDWPSEAVYPPARAALEGLAVVEWLYRPDVAGQERLDRVAELMLWSDPRAWEKVLTASGVDVQRNDAGVRFVGRGGNGRPLTWTRMLSDVFGDRGVALYGQWSKLAHNDPKRSAELTRWVVVSGGVAAKHEIREDEHLKLAADVADAITTVIERVGAYTGRPVDGPLADCRMVSARARKHVERAADHVEQRRAQETGQADADVP